MKKRLIWLVLTVMIFTGISAHAESVGRAAVVPDAADFERYPSYVCDAESGDWSVRANAADALEERFWNYGVNNGAEICVFTLEMEGNARTGVWTPVLRFYVYYGKDINATAVSVLVGENRYDLAARSDEAVNGRYTAERISAPLTCESMAVIEAMMNGEEVSFRLMGDTVKTVELSRESTNSRRKVEAESLNGLAAAIALLDEAGLQEYELWDLSADVWESRYGFRPAFAQCTVEKSIDGTELSDDFGMVCYNDQNQAVRAAQDVLIENGFLLVSGSTFGKNSVAATRRAQHYFGLIETGCMDAALVDALRNGVASPEEETPELRSLGGACMLSLDRYWFADGFGATGDPSNVRTVFDADNRMLIIDGVIRNISAEELRLYSAMEAQVHYGDVCAYEANIVCERNDGCEIDVTMLPMAQSRLVIYAEVPAWLTESGDGEWSLVLTAGGETVTCTLQ